MTPDEFREARLALRMSQVELARRLGRAVNTINRWERGQRAIPVDMQHTLRGLEWQLRPAMKDNADEVAQ